MQRVSGLIQPQGRCRKVSPAEPQWFRPICLVLLVAITIVPMVLITVHRALRERFDAHKRIARWTWPLWMYVSVTGVLVTQPRSWNGARSDF